MNINEIVKAIMETEVDGLFLYRSFLPQSVSTTITRRLNELIEDEPDLQDVITALSILPPLKWTQKSKEIHEVMGRICEDDEEIKRLGNVQSIIVKATDMAPKLLLENRKSYFDACEILIETIETAIEQIGEYPEHGEVYKNILTVFTGNPGQILPSKYNLNKYLKPAITVLYENYGEAIDTQLDIILSGATRSEDDISHVHHDIFCLLKEYHRILWRATNSDDRAMRLLECKTEEEMLEITKHDETYRQAYLLVEYIKLIKGAVEVVKSFPNGGKTYHSIISALMKNKPQNIADEVVARELEISTYSFSIKKRRALSVLSAVLWGCDGDSFVHLLTDVA